MRFLLRAVLSGVALGVIGCAVALALLLWRGLDRAPSIAEAPPALSAASVDAAMRRVGELDPRKARTQRGRITLSAEELRVLLQMAARRLPATRAELALTGRGDSALGTLRSSTALPAGLWLNTELQLGMDEDGPVLDRLRIGDLPLPPALARRLAAMLLPGVLERIGYHGDPALITQALRGAQLSSAGLSIDDRAGRSAARDGLRALLPPGEPERLADYHAALRQSLATPGERANSLLLPLQALFARASERAARGGDLLTEQRSALLVLTLHVTGRSPATLLPEAADWPAAPRTVLTLRGREDMAQHYLGSALIAAWAGGQWAQVIGLSKEMRDARSGSGFSFTDLLADRAGTRLGERIAAGHAEPAKRLAGGLNVDALLPPLDGLAEFMPEAEFVRRFGGVGAPGYRAVLADIDARIAALELYR